MADPKVTDDGDLPAGAFSSWLADVEGAIRGERGIDVPCAGCTACCRSSQFVHIEPDETETLAHIPAELLFPAPLRPPGHMILGYDERGHCPMLVDDACSIYEHRPRTCCTYDCRVFAATGIEPDDDKEPIARRARRWKFSFPTRDDHNDHESVKAAARLLAEHAELYAEGTVPDATPRAVLAIEIHRAFLRHDDARGTTVIEPDAATVRTELELVRPSLRAPRSTRS
jgi:Fe-S-cluster containining protein